uniref:Uncharacterized protein n=1 Tax=Rousettus aegyptiacus TaxID=9407 RepID=A0A7J8F0A9_ROUAE|nr:hypothetical protein HJG63_012254 [Rousettus aegyptiacus]
MPYKSKGDALGCKVCGEVRVGTLPGTRNCLQRRLKLSLLRVPGGPPLLQLVDIYMPFVTFVLQEGEDRCYCRHCGGHRDPVLSWPDIFNNCLSARSDRGINRLVISNPWTLHEHTPAIPWQSLVNTVFLGTCKVVSRSLACINMGCLCPLLLLVLSSQPLLHLEM